MYCNDQMIGLGIPKCGEMINDPKSLSFELKSKSKKIITLIMKQFEIVSIEVSRNIESSGEDGFGFIRQNNTIKVNYFNRSDEKEMFHWTFENNEIKYVN